jgi:hypothetical protein
MMVYQFCTAWRGIRKDSLLQAVARLAIYSNFHRAQQILDLLQLRWLAHPERRLLDLSRPTLPR